MKSSSSSFLTKRIEMSYKVFSWWRHFSFCLYFFCVLASFSIF